MIAYDKTQQSIFYYCADCGWIEYQDENAAEQRNEADSDGQKFPLANRDDEFDSVSLAHERRRNDHSTRNF